MTRPLDDLFEKSAGLVSTFGEIAHDIGQSAVSPPGRLAIPALQSFSPPGVSSLIGAGLREAFGAPSEEGARERAVSELFDPAHEAELATIRTQAMLSEFMSTDPVISTYDPEEVTTAYNQIVQIAPRASQQPAMMRGLLRKLLQQQDAMEPFEVGQLAEIEERLKKIEEPAQRIVTPAV